MTSETNVLHLVGDIGATNARFALADADGSLSHFTSSPCRDYENLDAAIVAFLTRANLPPPQRAVLAVATTPEGDQVRFTNNPWSFSIPDIARRTGIGAVDVINDFHANALALPFLNGADVMQVGGGQPLDGAPMAVLGPGSGLGVSSSVWAGDRFVAAPGEGGHVTMAACDRREAAVLDQLRERFEHISAERVLSGPGLSNLYWALCRLAGVTQPANLNAADICAAALARSDPHAIEAVGMFCAMLGTVAGDVALTLGSRGGVYIAGGIVPRLGTHFAASPFRNRFEAKGRLSRYLAAVPTYVIIRPDAALIGAASLLRHGGDR